MRKATNMSAHPVSRPADCTPQEAKHSLAAKWPTARLASFNLSEDGKQYVASLVFAGDNPFPPKDDAAPADDAPPAEPADDADGDADGDESGPPAPKKDKGDKGSEKKEVSEELTLLKEIAKALGLPVEGADEALAPDMGAPAGPMDGPAAGPVPPAPPVADAKPPLPPPAKPHGAPGGGGLGMPFSHIASLRQKVAQKRTFTTVVEAGPETSLREVVTHAAKVWPEFKPAKVERRTGRINGGQTQHLVVLAMRRK